MITAGRPCSMYSYSWWGHATVVKDVLQPQKMCCNCQRRAHIPQKANPYDTIVQTTNQAATCVQSLTTIAKYQVVAPLIQTRNHFFRYKYLHLDPKGDQAVN